MVGISEVCGRYDRRTRSLRSEWQSGRPAIERDYSMSACVQKGESFLREYVGDRVVEIKLIAEAQLTVFMVSALEHSMNLLARIR